MSTAKVIGRPERLQVGDGFIEMGAAPAHRLAVLDRYAQMDAEATGIARSNPTRASDESTPDFMARAGEVLFGRGDPVLDNLRRNLGVKVFLSFSSGEALSFAAAWLSKWQKNAYAPWHQEWVQIVARADAAEIEDILLSHDPERVRQRISMPFAEMLDFETVLRIKRRYRFEEV